MQKLLIGNRDISVVCKMLYKYKIGMNFPTLMLITRSLQGLRDIDMGTTVIPIVHLSQGSLKHPSIHSTYQLCEECKWTEAISRRGLKAIMLFCYIFDISVNGHTSKQEYPDLSNIYSSPYPIPAILKNLLSSNTVQWWPEAYVDHTYYQHKHPDDLQHVYNDFFNYGLDKIHEEVLEEVPHKIDDIMVNESLLTEIREIYEKQNNEQ